MMLKFLMMLKSMQKFLQKQRKISLPWYMRPQLHIYIVLPLVEIMTSLCRDVIEMNTREFIRLRIRVGTYMIDFSWYETATSKLIRQKRRDY